MQKPPSKLFYMALLFGAGFFLFKLIYAQRETKQNLPPFKFDAKLKEKVTETKNSTLPSLNEDTLPQDPKFQRLCRHHLDSSPELILKWAEERNKEHIWAYILTTWGHLAPRQAITWLLEQKHAKPFYTTSIVRGWAQDAPVAAMTWSLKLEDHHTRKESILGIFTIWVQNDKNAALEWLNTMNSETFYQELLVITCSSLAEKSERESLSWALKLPLKESRKAMLKPVRLYYERDKLAALLFISLLKESPHKEILIDIATAHIHRSLDLSLTQASALSGKIRKQALYSLLTQHAQKGEIEEATTLISNEFLTNKHSEAHFHLCLQLASINAPECFKLLRHGESFSLQQVQKILQKSSQYSPFETLIFLQKKKPLEHYALHNTQLDVDLAEELFTHSDTGLHSLIFQEEEITPESQSLIEKISSWRKLYFQSLELASAYYTRENFNAAFLHSSTLEEGAVADAVIKGLIHQAPHKQQRAMIQLCNRLSKQEERDQLFVSILIHNLSSYNAKRNLALLKEKKLLSNNNFLLFINQLSKKDALQASQILNDLSHFNKRTQSLARNIILPPFIKQKKHLALKWFKSFSTTQQNLAVPVLGLALRHLGPKLKKPWLKALSAEQRELLQKSLSKTIDIQQKNTTP